MTCIQDTLSSRAALGLPLGRVRRASKDILHTSNSLPHYQISLLCDFRTNDLSLFLATDMGIAISEFLVVYKIPYRLARAWPSGRVRARAKVYCIQNFWKNQGPLYRYHLKLFLRTLFFKLIP